MLYGLDLFTGIGGISYGLQPWVRTVCYVEIDEWCQRVIRERIGDGRLDDAPIWDDVREFDARPWVGAVDIISGGFPCQDISVAGHGAGLAGRRSGLFYEIARICRVIRPRFVFLENVPAIVVAGRGGWDVIGEFTQVGYDCRWGMLSAADVGAPHKRERWWCLAYAADAGRSEASGVLGECCEDGSDAYQPGLAVRSGKPGDDGSECASPFGDGWWSVEPAVGRVVDGFPGRVDQLKGLGNSVVPRCTREAFAMLISD